MYTSGPLRLNHKDILYKYNLKRQFRLLEDYSNCLSKISPIIYLNIHQLLGAGKCNPENYDHDVRVLIRVFFS